MKKIIIILLGCIVMSCATVSSSKTTKTPEIVDAVFKPYVQNFLDMSKGKVTADNIKEIPITLTEYGAEEEDTIGTCYRTPWFRLITINKKWWKHTKSELQKKAVIAHELGHCYLNRPHTTSDEAFAEWTGDEYKPLLDDNCPPSLMHPKVFSVQCMKKHYDYYTKELFQINKQLWNQDITKHNFYVKSL